MYIMTRTQIYLTDREARAVEQLARKTNKTKSDVIRHALDLYLGLNQGGNAPMAFGVWARKKKGGVALQRKLRSEWDK